MIPAATSLLITFLLSLALQFLSFLISAPLRTEKLYDLSGAVTFSTCTLVALFWRHDDADGGATGLAARQIVAACCVGLWTLRLGGFLCWRAVKVGDKRFDEYKDQPLKFAFVWIMQAIWVFLTALPVYIILGNAGSSQPSFSWSDILGVIIYIAGLTIEVVADVQKQVFKSAHPRDFVRSGIWRWSRYANYFGECVLWVGVFVLCCKGFVEGWQWVGVVSPVFVVVLVVGVSGVRLSEKGAEERYGGRADWQQYKAQTSKFFLWPPKRTPPIEVNPEPETV